AGRLHFFGTELQRARYAPDRQHGAGGDQLDEVGAVIEEVTRAVAGFGRIANLAHSELFGHRDVSRERVDLAAATRHRDVAAGHEHARPLDLAGVDRVAQRDV